jgi:hypothetical protein
LSSAERQRNQKLVDNNNQDYDGIDKSKGEDLVFTVPTITAACAANPACASATAAGIVYVGSKIAEPVAEAVSAVGDAIADGVVIAVDAVQDALNKTTEDESEDNSGVVGTGAPMPDGEPPEDWDDKNNHKYKPSPEKPEDIKGIPNLRKVRKKTSVQGGGKKRTRYKDKKGNIYEWDYRHGTLEKYNKRGKHLGEYNPKTGKQLKPANKTRRIEP